MDSSAVPKPPEVIPQQPPARQQGKHNNCTLIKMMSHLLMFLITHAQAEAPKTEKFRPISEINAEFTQLLEASSDKMLPFKLVKCN